YDNASHLTQLNSGGVRRSAFTYDTMGRMLTQNDYQSDGTTVAFSRAITWNGKSQTTYEVDDTRRGSTVYETRATTDYGSGTSYLLGSINTVSVGNYTNGTFQNTSLTTNGYGWYDGATQASITFKPDVNQSTTTSTSYGYANYGGVAELTSVYV